MLPSLDSEKEAKPVLQLHADDNPFQDAEAVSTVTQGKLQTMDSWGQEISTPLSIVGFDQSAHVRPLTFERPQADANDKDDGRPNIHPRTPQAIITHELRTVTSKGRPKNPTRAEAPLLELVDANLTPEQLKQQAAPLLNNKGLPRSVRVRRSDEIHRQVRSGMLGLAAPRPVSSCSFQPLSVPHPYCVFV